MNSSFSKILCFWFLRFWHFWREDITNLVPNFGFANMGYLMLLFTKISKLKKGLKCVHQSKDVTF